MIGFFWLIAYCQKYNHRTDPDWSTENFLYKFYTSMLFEIFPKHRPAGFLVASPTLPPHSFRL